MSFWTEARVERLVELWDRPMSVQEIADVLGATKSAVCGKARRLDLEHRPPLPVFRRRRVKRGRAFEFRHKKPVEPKLKIVKAPPQHDYSWHLAQFREMGEPRAKVQPPAGAPSWRTFTRAVAADPALKAALDRARQERKDRGWVRRKKVA